MNWTRIRCYRRINFYTIIFMIIGAIFIATTLSFAATVVEPSRFIFMANRGDKVTGTIKVTNDSPKEIFLNAILYDWDLSKDDKMITFDAGTRKETLKGLIKFNPQNFRLPPGRSQIVRFTVSAPASGPLFERRGIVFFEERSTIKDGFGQGAVVIAKVGTTIYLNLKGTRMGARVTDSSVNKLSPGKYQTSLEIANQGLGHIRYFISYKIVNQKGALVFENQLTEKVILPQSNQKLSFHLPENLAPGKYNLILNINFHGTDRAYSETIPFEVDK